MYDYSGKIRILLELCMDREIYILDGEKHNNFDELKEQLMNLFDYEGFDISNGAALRDSFPYYSMITLIADQIKDIFDLSFFLKVSPKDIIDLAQKYTKGFLVIELLNADELSQDLDDYISALESLNNIETNVRFTKVSF